jgi:hypothetical protein
MNRQEPVERSELDRAVDLLWIELHEGLRHGFFEFKLECELVNGRKRQLTMTFGRSHRFFITDDDLNEHGPGDPRKRMK